MPDPVTLAKARLVELDATFKNPKPGGRTVTVQFNPDTLKVSYANRSQQSQSAGDQRGNAPRQVVGSGASKLSLQLWFDVNGEGSGGARDVRRLTEPVTALMIPASPAGGATGANQPAPPGVGFRWGTFRFDGLIDSLEETLDFFSPDGRPLRASLQIGMSGQVEVVPPDGGAASPAATAGPTPGTRPLTFAPEGGNLPGLVAALGSGADWQTVAARNGIENPRLLAAGTVLDLSADIDLGRAR